MILDATVAEQAIRFPTDLSLLNESREISELIIDILRCLSGAKAKPRTYRKTARKDYLSIVKWKGKKLRAARSNVALKCKCCDDRIVSIHQSHVRHIIRGKANKSAEFGAKLSVSLKTEGIASVDRIS